jgi:AraC family transcriptional activator of pobA
MKRPATPGGQIRAVRFEGAFMPRVIDRAEESSVRAWIMLLLEDGAVEIKSAGTSHTATNSCVIWHRRKEGDKVTLHPGSSGIYIIFDLLSLERAVGTAPDSQPLRDLTSLNLHLLAADRPRTYSALRHAFYEIVRHAADHSLAGRLLFEGYLRVVLLELLSVVNLNLLPAATGTSAKQIFKRFMALVETHYFERPSVEDCANKLRVTPDRLHDICLREHGLTPKKLIDKRLCIEATMLLESSANSIEQISEILRFSSASHFNRFFTRNIGITPGRMRRQMKHPTRSRDLPPNIYEWP